MAKYEAKKFRSFDVELTGISKKTMEEHYKLYQGYVSKANEILDRLGSGQVDLSKANPTYSELRELKVELTRAIGGVKNHELYFEHLGGKGGEARGEAPRDDREDLRVLRTVAGGLAGHRDRGPRMGVACL